jgi:hypothetical protein
MNGVPSNVDTMDAFPIGELASIATDVNDVIAISGQCNR